MPERTHNPLLSELTSKAIAIAIEAHNHQTRKSGSALQIPYICHPLEIVSMLMKAVGCDEVILAAAAVHDTVEDTETTIEDIARELGLEVAKIVLWLSDGDYQGGVKPDKRWRKERYITKIQNAPDDVRYAVQLISAVDKLASGLDYLADADTNPQSRENAELNLWFYGELMPTYLEVLKPYPRLHLQMAQCWDALQIIWGEKW